MNYKSFIFQRYLIAVLGIMSAGVVFATCDIPSDSIIPLSVCAGSGNGSRDCDIARAQDRYCATQDLNAQSVPQFYSSGPEIREQQAFCVQNLSPLQSTCYQLNTDIPDTSRTNPLSNRPEGAWVDYYGNVWFINEQTQALGCMAANADPLKGNDRDHHCGFAATEATDNIMLRVPNVYTDVGSGFYGVENGFQNQANIATSASETTLWFSMNSTSTMDGTGLFSQVDRSTLGGDDKTLVQQPIVYGAVSLPSRDIWCTRHRPQYQLNGVTGGVPDHYGACLTMGQNFPYGPSYGYNPVGLSKIFSLKVNHAANVDPVWRVYYPVGLPNSSLTKTMIAGEGKQGDTERRVHNLQRDSQGRIWYAVYSTDHLAQMGYFDPNDFVDGAFQDMAPNECSFNMAGDKRDLCVQYTEPVCKPSGVTTPYENCFHTFDLPNLPYITDFQFDQYGDIWLLSGVGGIVGRLDLVDGVNQPTIPELLGVRLYPLDQGMMGSLNTAMVDGPEVTRGASQWISLKQVDEGGGAVREYLMIGLIELSAMGVFDITAAAAGGCDNAGWIDNPCHHVLQLGRGNTDLINKQFSTAAGDSVFGWFGNYEGGSSSMVAPAGNLRDELSFAIAGVGRGKNFSNFLTNGSARKIDEYQLGTTMLDDPSDLNQIDVVDGVDLMGTSPSGEEPGGDLWGIAVSLSSMGHVKYQKSEKNMLIVDAYADIGKTQFSEMPISRMGLKSKGNCLGGWYAMRCASCQ